MAGMALFVLTIVAIAVLAFIFWILMLIDCAKRKFKNNNEKVVWIVVIALLGALGAAIYYFAVKLPDKNKGKRKR